MVDGCTKMGALMRILLPLSAPGLVASAIFSFTLAWNEFLLALVITMDQSTMTVPIKLTMMVVGDQYIWGQLMAGAVLASIPVAVLYFIGQRYVVQGFVGRGGKRASPARPQEVELRPRRPEKGGATRIRLGLKLSPRVRLMTDADALRSHLFFPYPFYRNNRSSTLINGGISMPDAIPVRKPELDLETFEKEICVRPLRRDDFDRIVELQLRCFPNMEPWKLRSDA